MSNVSDLRQALRTLRKSSTFTLVAVSALAVGIGANSAIFTVVSAVLFRPLPYPEPDRIVYVERKFPEGTGDSTSIPKFNVWKKGNEALELVSAFDFAGPGMNLGGGENPEQVRGIHASMDYFRLFGATPALGRTFTVEEDAPGGAHVVVLSHGLWTRRFGADRGILGRPVQIGGDSHTVIGVLGAAFQPEPQADLWLPLQADPNSANQGHYLRCAARLRPGITLESARAHLKLVAERFRRLYPEWISKGESVTATPMQQALAGDVRLVLLVLLSAVGFVLLIACANVANLLLARGLGRQKEIAIRSALGASRGRLVRQLLVESLLLSAAGAAAGTGLGYAGVRALTAANPDAIPRVAYLSGGLRMDWRVLLFTAALSVVTAVLFGLVPALQVSRTDLSSTLKESGSRAGTGRHQDRARGILVAAEMALALMLLVGAGLFLRTFVGLRNVDPGIDPRNILTTQVSLAGSRYSTTARVAELSRRVVERIEALPGVESASIAVALPATDIGIDLPFSIEGKPPKDGRYNGDEFWRFAGPHYFDVLRIPIRRGRGFNDRDGAGAPPVVIVNQAMAKKYWPGEDPIGSRITIGKGLGPQFDDPPRQIVGIVGDVREGGLSRPPAPVMYIPVGQVPDGLMKLGAQVIPLSWMVRAVRDPLALSRSVQREFLSVDAQLPAGAGRTFEQAIVETTVREKFTALLVSLFAAIALLLAAVGIYGLMSYYVEQRTHELGVRMALGAARHDTLRLVIVRGMRLALIGVVFGAAGAYGLTRLVGTLLFGVKSTDPVTYTAVAGVLLAVALLATWIPALRATRVDPIVALRCE